MRLTLLLAGFLALLLILAIPVSAVNGTISIAYRGPGGNYIGDTIIFDGFNSFSNMTLIRITGPGLPTAGVPVYDMNGEPGTGNIIPGISNPGAWKFVYYTGSIKGIDKLQTARYYFTAFDASNPEKSATTSILLKKPEFYVDVTPNTGEYGDYIQLTGIAEKGSSNVHFEITDANGKRAHAYDSSVSATGYYNKGFHIDMDPGIYTITMSSPSVKYVYTNYLTVNPPGTASAAGRNQSIPSEVPSTPAPTGPGSLSVMSAPAGATVFIDSAMAGTTPYTLAAIPSGVHLIEIKAPGYTSYSQQVMVSPGQEVTMNPVLVKNSSSLPLSAATILTALVIALVAIAFVARRQGQ